MLEFRSGGEAAFYAVLGVEAIDEAVNDRVQMLARGLEGTLGLTDLIAGYWNLLIEFDPRLTTQSQLETIVSQRFSSLEQTAQHQRAEIVIPVRYDGAELLEVSRLTGLSPNEIARVHTARTYRVYALGFTPGFAYLGSLESVLHVPRLSVPRTVTPPHSVAIAGAQTGIYPLASPGGWRVIGNALRRVFDPTRTSPFLLQAGDTVRFVSRPDGQLEGEAGEVTPNSARDGIPTFAVLEAGLLTSVQDDGRRMVGRYGLGRAGALDQRSSHLANALVGNRSDAATLEISLRGPTLEVLSPALIAVTGGGVSLRHNGRDAPLNQSLAVKPGDRLEFPHATRGARAYLAVRGGWNAPQIYGSISTDLRSGIGGQRLTAGAVLHRVETRDAGRAGFAFTPFSAARGVTTLRISRGPQASLFPPSTWQTFLSATYVVTSGDRMGLRLFGAALGAERFEIVSEGVPVGSIQVNSSGLPMLLLSDRGTLGGYAKIAVVQRRDLPKAAQLRSGEALRFRLEG